MKRPFSSKFPLRDVTCSCVANDTSSLSQRHWGKWGYWDQEWNIIIPAIYDEVQPNFDTIMAVKKDGKMGACCGAEAKRLVLAMPKWTPGKKNGKPVRVEYTMPVRFKLE